MQGQIAGTSALPVVTTRNDKMENHHPSHSKSAAPGTPAWSNKPSLTKVTSIDCCSRPPRSSWFGNPVYKFRQTCLNKKKKKIQDQHMQLFTSLVHVFHRPVFNPPFHEGALAPCTRQPHQRGPLKPLGSSQHATFSKPMGIWLQVAIEQAVMAQGYR